MITLIIDNRFMNWLSGCRKMLKKQNLYRVILTFLKIQYCPVIELN